MGAYFNDPRIADASRAVHFAIEISARDGTAAYAVELATVHIVQPFARYPSPAPDEAS